MRFLPPVALAIAALAGCYPDPAPGAARPVCPLRIGFSSYAMGIDLGAYRAVEALLAGDPAVTGVRRSSAGREGETELCVQVRREADAERLFRAVAARFPADPRGPLTVATASGLRFESPPRPR